MEEITLTVAEKAELDNLFTHHPPHGDQAARYGRIRESARQFAEVILLSAPQSADRSAAIRKVREAVMTANAAIAINEKPPAAAQPANA